MPWDSTACDVEARTTSGARAGHERASRVSGRVLREAWTLLHGTEWPTGMFACHHCDDPRCSNPEHIYPGTQSDNIRDAFARGRLGGSLHGAGERHRFSKFTQDQVDAIRASKDETLDLALRYAVHRTTITRIRAGKRWEVSLSPGT